MTIDLISILAGGILFLVSSYIGIAVRRHYKKRRDFFKTLMEFIDVLTDEISFLKTPLPDIISRFSEEKKGDFIALLKIYNARIDAGASTDPKSLAAAFSIGMLSAAERDGVTAFFAALGKTDAQTQLLSLKNNRGKTEAMLAAAENKYKTTGMLAYKLGVLLGIAIMIFVV